jgi:2-polyprenyl-3-methyl-5-hydroxy-6-metoxy-1,4-benzoquinol methylase
MPAIGMTKKQTEAIQLIRRISSGYWASRVFLTAATHTLFDHLEKPVTSKGLAKKRSLDPRALEIVLDALVSIGLVKKTKKNYHNSGAASSFLVSGKPYYQGDILAHHASLWERWSDLDDILKEGVPSSRGRDFESFIQGMHNLSVLKSEKIVSQLDLKGVGRVLDLGGGPGTYSVSFAKRGMDVTLFDMKDTYRIAKDVIGSSPVKGTISFKGGDFVHDDIGKGYDLVLISQIFHAYGEKENMNLLRKVRKALNRNGRVLIQEFLVNDDRTSPVPGALFAVNMLVNTSEGRTYSPREMIAWLRKTGFGSVKRSFFEDNVLIEARKASR